MRFGQVATEENQAQSAFWEEVGAGFPSLKGAMSTTYYSDCERLLFQTFVPELSGKRVFKTDLWDEAKNSEILQWVAREGGRVAGIDLSPSTPRQASRQIWPSAPGFAVADIRAAPFRSGAFDVVYSMGTIEHFPEYAEATAEIFRLLKPGGIAIIGVPNRLDPFFRPVLVTLLNWFGWYAYGSEKSFTVGQLQALLEGAGFRVTGRSGILFIPGWLRMLDLVALTRARWLCPVTGALVAPFAWAFRHIPVVRGHGYLIVCVGTKPE